MKFQTMKRRWSLPAASTAVAAAVMFFLAAIAMPSAAVVVQHTFVVSQVNMTHLCKDTLVTVVNGQLPGPTIEVTEGDSVSVHVVNKSPYNITIHWHGVKQRLNCWADGVPMITQRPILPNYSFTYRFNVTEQEGTLWWHAHVPGLRATLHGALIIRPRHGAEYPFPQPDREVPIIIGEWWQKDLAQVGWDLSHSYFDDDNSASTINGKLGDLYNCSGVAEDGFVLEVEPGKTYLLRLINAALFNEYYLKIAGHRFTVVASDANYLSPYDTDVIAIAPGETVDALLVADAHPGKYYMVALPNQSPPPSVQTPEYVTRGIVQYRNKHSSGNDDAEDSLSSDVPMVPEMPDQNDMAASFYFRDNQTSLCHPRIPPVPTQVDESLFVTLGLGFSSICWPHQDCKRGFVATLNNISFDLPMVTTPLLEAHYYNITGEMDMLLQLPGRPPRVFNFTDSDLIAEAPEAARLGTTSRAILARRFQYGAVVDVVFQSTALLQSEPNPMHLHGHDMFVLAQGLGNYDAAKDVARYNLLNPPLRNTVMVPSLGWAAVRFTADNPGVWYMHCHFEFHLSMGMTALFIVEDGPTVDTSLPPPPADLLSYGNDNDLLQDEFSIRAEKNEIAK